MTTDLVAQSLRSLDAAAAYADACGAIAGAITVAELRARVTQAIVTLEKAASAKCSYAQSLFSGIAQGPQDEDAVFLLDVLDADMAAIERDANAQRDELCALLDALTRANGPIAQA